MPWFSRTKRPDIWDEAIDQPLGDIGAADRIRAICEAANVCAIAAANGDKSESARYERAARVAMEIVMKISDGLIRDDAVHRIIDLCMKAGDLKTAQILLRAIHANWIREMVQHDHPDLIS